MSKQYLAPEGLVSSEQYCYSQVVVSEPGQQIFLAGQTAWDTSGEIVGGADLAVQAEKTLQNIDAALKAAGATRRDLTQMRVYMVDYTPEYIEILMPVFKAFFGDVPPPAQTWVGVQALALPEFLIEIEAVAVRS